MENELKNGKVVKAIGTIVDVRFLDSYLPDLLTALTFLTPERSSARTANIKRFSARS